MSVTPIDRTRADIDRIFTEHPTLHQLTKDNAEVYAWFKQAARGACTVEEALVGIVVRLCDTNQKQFDEIIKLNMKESRNGRTETN